jgi:hypothetical protein
MRAINRVSEKKVLRPAVDAAKQENVMKDVPNEVNAD